MKTVSDMAQMIGISEQNMKMFLDLYAIEVKAGSTLEDAIRNVHQLFMNLAEQAQKPECEQAQWFVDLKRGIAADVWNSVRGNA